MRLCAVVAFLFCHPCTPHDLAVACLDLWSSRRVQVNLEMEEPKERTYQGMDPIGRMAVQTYVGYVVLMEYEFDHVRGLSRANEKWKTLSHAEKKTAQKKFVLNAKFNQLLMSGMRETVVFEFLFVIEASGRHDPTSSCAQTHLCLSVGL